MEFLLQLFADFLGTPVEEEKTPQNNVREDKLKLETEEMLKQEQEEEFSEEQILFELMQFH
ncbi:MAG: hypothetical protein ACQER7_11635 [Bacteroidota bacterium]